MEKKVLISENTLKERIKELASEITKDFEGEPITLVCIFLIITVMLYISTI